MDVCMDVCMFVCSYIYIYIYIYIYVYIYDSGGAAAFVYRLNFIRSLRGARWSNRLIHPLLLAATPLASSQHTLTSADAWMHPLMMAAKRSASRFALAALHSSCSRCAAVAAGAQHSISLLYSTRLGRRLKRLKLFFSAICQGHLTKLKASYTSTSRPHTLAA